MFAAWYDRGEDGGAFEGWEFVELVDPSVDLAADALAVSVVGTEVAVVVEFGGVGVVVPEMFGCHCATAGDGLEGDVVPLLQDSHV